MKEFNGTLKLGPKIILNCIIVVGFFIFFYIIAQYIANSQQKHFAQAQQMIKKFDAGDYYSWTAYLHLKKIIRDNHFTLAQLGITKDRVALWNKLTARRYIVEDLETVRKFQNDINKYCRGYNDIFERLLDDSRLADAQITLENLGTSRKELESLRNKLTVYAALENLKMVRKNWTKDEKNMTQIFQAMKDAKAGLVKISPSECQQYTDYGLDVLAGQYEGEIY